VFMVIGVLLSRYKVIPLSIISSLLLSLGLASLPVVTFWIPLLWLASLIGLKKYDGLLTGKLKKSALVLFCILVFLSLAALLEVVRSGLVLQPPMLITGNGSNSSILRWYLDQSSGELVRPWVISLPLYFWRGFALFWSLWLVVALFGWFRDSVDRVRALIAD